MKSQTHINKEGEKKPYLIQLGDGELIYFAGVWRKEKYNDDKRRVFSIITKPANKKISEIHHRMPIIFNANNAQDYLDDKENNLIFVIPYIYLIDFSTEKMKMSHSQINQFIFSNTKDTRYMK